MPFHFIFQNANFSRHFTKLTIEWNNVKVHLDDERETPEGWTRMYRPEEAIELLRPGMVEVNSLAHDLGDDDRDRGLRRGEVYQGTGRHGRLCSTGDASPLARMFRLERRWSWGSD